jgi:uncharacterized protein
VVSFFFLLFFSQAQTVQLPQKTIVFDNGVSLKVEMALTTEQKSRGLMERTSLAQGTGMLFNFEPPQVLSFWMKNTLIPLTVGFFRANKTLIETFDMEPSHGPVREDLLPRYMSTEPAQYAIEVPKGWFAKNKIRSGMKFRFQK